MAQAPNKAIVVGFDAPIVPRLYRFAKEGHLPTIRKLFVNGGVWAKNCLVPLPTVTPPNWAAISTGAWPSTIGITDFNIHEPGDPLDKLHQGLFSGDVKAENLYEALAKAGKKPIIVNYPSTWPPKARNSIVIGGAMLAINAWAQEVPLVNRAAPEGGLMQVGEATAKVTYAGPSVYSTDSLRGGVVLTFGPPEGWRHLPAGEARAAEMPLRFAGSMYDMEPVTWHILVHRGKATVCESKDAAKKIATLTPGKWSPPITRVFRTAKGAKKAIFKMKLLELAPDAEKFRLFLTSIAAADGWSHPASIAGEIKSKEGVPGPGSPWGGLANGWYGLDTVAELEEIENAFLADAACYLLKNKPWDFYQMHAHAPDSLYHAISDRIDDPDPEKREPFEKVELEMYKSLDRMCAKIFGCADEHTLMAIVSDHGAKPNSGTFGPNRVLQDAGLLARDKNRVIDWSKTKAYAAATTHVYVNLKGRDPQGIVEPGDEYRKVQEEIVSAFHNFTDPKSGVKPVTFALRKEDARMIGVHGEYAGDVIYGITGAFGAQHSPNLPTSTHGIGDLHGLLALSGPNIKRGLVLERTVWIQDLVPTICYMTGWPVPAQAEGAVIYQAMKDPNARPAPTT